MILKFMIRSIGMIQQVHMGTLSLASKLFLDRYVLGKLYDFEEECVENYLYQVE